MSKFLKDYEKKVLELENKNLKKEIDELKSKIWDFEHMENRFKHLMESEFIKSFSMYTGNGQWQRPIDEADKIAYGKGLINATIPLETVTETVDIMTEFIKFSSVIEDPKSVVISCERMLSENKINDIIEDFKSIGIKCIVVCGCHDINYII